MQGVLVVKFDEERGYIPQAVYPSKLRKRKYTDLYKEIARNAIGFGTQVEYQAFSLSESHGAPEIHCIAKRFSISVTEARGGATLYALVVFSGETDEFDKGLGLFAGVTVLPKSAWFGSYSYRVNRQMNKRFLKSLHEKVEKLIPSSGDFNLDFTTIPHWGDESILEHNWSGTRRVGLKSVLALLVQDQNSRLLKYGDTEIKHANQSDKILEFIDFY